MIKEKEVHELIDQLYNYISFAEGEEPKVGKLNELFIEGAVVIEYSDDQCLTFVQKTIETHIQEFKDVLEKYPIIKEKGFTEIPLEKHITFSGPLAYVESKYEKNILTEKNLL